jgi:hypothetical protein
MDLFYGDVHRLAFPHMPLPDYEKHICYMFLQLIYMKIANITSQLGEFMDTIYEVLAFFLIVLRYILKVCLVSKNIKYLFFLVFSNDFDVLIYKKLMHSRVDIIFEKHSAPQHQINTKSQPFF